MTRILLVDDVDLFLELERTFLKRFGCEIVTARNGEEALARVSAQLPDAILLDAEMPVLDGYQTCRALKEDDRTRQIPVILVSARPDPLKAGEVGADDLVGKPIRRDSLLETIRRHVPIVERGFDRVPVSLRVRIDGEGAQRRSAFSKDLSQGGIFLKTSPPLPLGQKVGLRIRLPFPGGAEEVHIVGEVVRQVPDAPETHLIPGVGVRFLETAAPERAKVGRFVRTRIPTA